MDYEGKPIIPTKTALNELSNLNLDLYAVAEILKNGSEIRKRSKNVAEKIITRGNKAVNVVVVDMGNYYKLIHAGEFTLTKKIRRLMKKNEA